jgi:type IV pilus assembly protein PilO
MELMLQQMLRQLPSKNEMPDLIVDVSQTALATGISNELFQPGRRRRRSSTPRSRSPAHGGHLPPVRRLRQRRRLAAARGDHDHAQHLADAARGQAGLLVLEGTIRTYRYLDDEEIANARPQGGASDAHASTRRRKRPPGLLLAAGAAAPPAPATRARSSSGSPK